MAGGFSVTVSAVDQATKVIDGVNRKLKAMSAPVERLQSSLSKFSRLSGLSDLAAGMGKLGRGALDVFRGISSIIAPLGAITGAASLAGMYRMTSAWALWGQQMAITAMRIGTTAPQLQHLENVAQLAGTSAGAMDAGLQGFADTMAAVSKGLPGSGETITALRSIGLDADFAGEAVKHPTEGILKLFLALQKISNPTLRSQVGGALTGGNFDALGGIANKSAAEIARLSDEARRHGEQTDEDIAKAKMLAASNAGLKESVESLGNAVASAVSGPLISINTAMSAWIDANRDWIATKVNEYLERFVKWIEGVNWTEVGAGITGFATGAAGLAVSLADAIGWLDRMGIAGPALGVLLTAGLLGPLTGIVAQLAWLTAWKLPAALLALTGLSGPALAGITAVLGAGAAAGAMNMPMLDDLGNQLPGGANWGGADGEANRLRLAPAFRRGMSLTDAQTQDTSPPPARAPFVPLGTRMWRGLFGGPDASQGTGGERNLRNNNPTNLSFAGQANAVSDGRFARFPNMETGVAADLNQFLLYQQRGKTSIEDMLHTATPLSDNPGAESYIDRVSKAMGIGRGASPNLRDPVTAKRFILAVAPNEGGTPNPDAVARGVGMRLGTLAPGAPTLTPPAPAASGPPAIVNSAPGSGGSADTPAPANGKLDVTVRHENPPPGAKVTASASGDAVNGAPRIVSGMPDMALP